MDITGSNFIGKTALLELIQELYKPTKSKILIDGRNIKNYNKIKLREKIAFLPDQGKPFHGTILESITLFRCEKIEEARKLSDHFGLFELI
ncbi:ATP-binding cassette domain-containing protein [Coxiella-like endosymbiont]|uniref:ATP-binding cassette domain-containing protein n=1 Tax=Coxiella-like endosymbiont TaxID=1592897 RepID=UPI00272C1C25|nr:ATP-binding cassette domain-containing protein [Coxiella-like endosymbiont]